MVKTSLVPVACLALLVAPAHTVSAQGTCQAEGQILEGHQALVFHLGGIPDGGLALHVAVKDDGRAHGTAHITDGTSNTISWPNGYPCSTATTPT
jgi:hypothetical protein